MLPKLKYILCDGLRVLDHIPCDLTNHFRILLRRKEYGMKDLCDLFERDWLVFIVLAKQGSRWLKFAGLFSVTVDHSIQSKHDFILLLT